MTEENNSLETWEAVIINFLERKKAAEEENYLKEQIKAIVSAFEKQKYFGNQDIKNFFDTNNKKEKNQSSLDFQRKRLETTLSFQQQPEAIDSSEVEREYKEKCNKIAAKFSPNKWISEASQNAASVSFATHVIKLTHSKIDSPSFYDQIDVQKNDTLSTSSIKEKTIDGAVSGNQFAPIYQFLELELNEQKLASTFVDETNEILKPFAQSDEELICWNKGFSKSLKTDSISSHSLAKQVYFPLGQNRNLYHLLCHVKSSSLAHEIFEKVIDDEQKSVRKLRQKNKFSCLAAVSFPRKANINVTASNHSNASQLNGKRGGKLYLFSSQPPTWQSQLKPPINHLSLFYAIFLNTNTRTTLDYLRDFLLRHQDNDLSIRDPERRKWIDKWVNDIIDEVLSYAADIQNLQFGWSDRDGIKLKLSHQYFLDPYRDDEAFQKARKASNWQTEVCNDFARWLNYKLIGKDKKFTPQKVHSRIWAELLEQPLREHNQMIEADMQTREEA